jgi:hypothetical protein
MNKTTDRIGQSSRYQRVGTILPLCRKEV